MTRSPAGAYRLVFTPEARQRWDVLPPSKRLPLERAVERLASTAGMRQWVSDHEAREELQLRLRGLRLVYCLEPKARTLTLLRVEMAP